MRIALDGRALPAFPCYPNKRPACANGFKDASTDPERLAALWAGRSGLLVAVPTGPVSGIAVLDVDQPWPGEADLPSTRRHQTRSGGRHWMFRDRPGLRCSQGVIAPGVDVRAEGGYVIWWPALAYAVDYRALADWPDWLVPEVKERPRPSTAEGWSLPYCANTADLPRPSTISREVTIFARFEKKVPRWSPEESHALVSANRAQDRLGKVPVGQRNHALNGEAYALGRQVARGWISGSQALLALWLGAQECGYVRDHGEPLTLAAIRHGLLDGMQVPYADLEF